MSESQDKGMIAQVSENLGSVFRYLLPGVLIVGTAAVTHPSWFAHTDLNSWPTLVVIAVVSIAVGNVVFCVNRYALHQLIDLICYLFRSQGPAMRERYAYPDDLAIYVRQALIEADVPDRARRHVEFRASSILLMYTIVEISLIAAFCSDSDSLTCRYDLKVPLLIFSQLVFGFAIWQNVLARRIDAAVLHKNRVPGPTKACRPTCAGAEPVRGELIND